jgi:two-component system sensor kinase FixL
MGDALSIYSAKNRNRILVVAALLIAGIAFVDWLTPPYLSIGFLYLFPIMLIGGVLSRWQIVAVALLCAVLQELFANLPRADATPRLVLSSVGFIATGLFVSQLIRTRHLMLRNLEEIETQVSLRRDAEEQLNILVESSPAAIVTVGGDGNILLANAAAQQLFAPETNPLQGQPIINYLPTLHTVARVHSSKLFRTTLQCKGQRSSGEVFLAGVWFSRYMTGSGPRVAAIVVDLSEDLRNREELSLDHLLKNTRILMSAVSHEIRNLCGAALVVHKNLSRVEALENNEDFRALGTLIGGLEKISALELRPLNDGSRAAIQLSSVLDELRVLIETSYQESEIRVEWKTAEPLPLVWADRYGLLQVLLNLARNSQRAMENSRRKHLTVSASVEQDSVVVRFEDTGIGIANPENLFRPFQRGADSSGLGLYVSRAILKSFSAEIVHEARAQGCCFAVVLEAVPVSEEVPNA